MKLAIAELDRLLAVPQGIMTFKLQEDTRSCLTFGEEAMLVLADLQEAQNRLGKRDGALNVKLTKTREYIGDLKEHNSSPHLCAW